MQVDLDQTRRGTHGGAEHRSFCHKARIDNRSSVTLEETAKKDICWRVEGTDLDGRRIQVVVAVYEEAIKIKVITVF
jgi:hypothetical protein